MHPAMSRLTRVEIRVMQARLRFHKNKAVKAVV